MNPCPTKCGRNAALGNLLCAPCWHAVPHALQAEVWRTWRAWKKDLGSSAACAAYRAAAAVATAAAREKTFQLGLKLWPNGTF